MAPLEDHSVLADYCERPLLRPKRGAFLDTDLRALRMAAESSEDGHVGIDSKRIISPVTGGHHAAVEVEDPNNLPAIETGDWAPIPDIRERRDDAQALFAFGCG